MPSAAVPMYGQTRFGEAMAAATRWLSSVSAHHHLDPGQRVASTLPVTLGLAKSKIL